MRGNSILYKDRSILHKEDDNDNGQYVKSDKRSTEANV